VHASSNSRSIGKSGTYAKEFCPVHTPPPRDQFHRPQDRNSSWKEGLHAVGNAGLATHNSKASEGLAKFRFCSLDALGCDPGTKTVPDDQDILGFSALTNQPFDGR